MYLLKLSRGHRFGTLSTLARALLLVAAVMGAGWSAAVTAAPDDKPKASAADPNSKAVDAPAPVAPPADASNAAAVSGAIHRAVGGAVGATVRGATGASPDAETDADTPSPSTKKSHRHAHIQIGDDDFDSFNDALRTSPWVIGLAFLVAGSVLLTPVFLLIGIIWYKLRKTRMQNEAMLQLAEKGVMPPAQAVDAVMSGTSPEAAAASASVPPAASAATPVYQQAIITRRRAVWSDLRRGVIFIAIGLSFVFYSLFDSGSANWLGLALLFLGIGYTLLWWFEDRHLQDRESSAGIDVGKR